MVLNPPMSGGIPEGRPTTAVFIDAEGLFFHTIAGGSDQLWDTTAAEGREVPELPERTGDTLARLADQGDDVRLRRGPMMAARLHTWLDRHFSVLVRSSVGKIEDPGVAAVWETFVHCFRWTHTAVHQGDSVADLYLIDQLRLHLGGRPDIAAYVIGAQDRGDVLQPAAAAMRSDRRRVLGAVVRSTKVTGDGNLDPPKGFAPHEDLARYDFHRGLIEIVTEEFARETAHEPGWVTPPPGARELRAYRSTHAKEEVGRLEKVLKRRGRTIIKRLERDRDARPYVAHLLEKATTARSLAVEAQALTWAVTRLRQRGPLQRERWLVEDLDAVDRCIGELFVARQAELTGSSGLGAATRTGAEEGIATMPQPRRGIEDVVTSDDD